jgi:3-oxoacyl-[acyl-carrier protein] reductase
MVEKGRVAIVTGGSRGIGRAIAERLGRDGMSVVVNYFANRGGDERQLADAVVRSIESGGSAAVAAEGSVADAAAVRGLFDIAEQQFGGIDVVVLNAAAWRFALIAEATEEDFDLVFGTNVRGTFVALHEAANRVRDGGRIVAISAGLALMPRPATGLYGASKAAINQLVRVLANEIGSRQITVNSVMPGAVNTDALKDNPAGNADEFVAAEIARTPLGRIGAPQDIADVVGFLVSDEGRWITGQNIGAGGGMF